MSLLDKASTATKGDLKTQIEAEAQECRRKLRAAKPLPAQHAACQAAIDRSQKRLDAKKAALSQASAAVREENATLARYKAEMEEIRAAFAAAGEDPDEPRTERRPRTAQMDGADVHILSDDEHMDDGDEEEEGYCDSGWQHRPSSWGSSWDNWDGYGVSSEPAPPSSCPTTVSRVEDPRVAQLEGVVLNLSTKFDQLLAHLGPGGGATPAPEAPVTPVPAAPTVAAAGAPATSPAGGAERSGTRSPRGRARDRDRPPSAAPPSTTGPATEASRRASVEVTPP